MSVFQRKTSGSVVCPSCGSLVGVNDDQCYVCGRRNPSLWGFSPVLKRLGTDLGLVPLVMGISVVVYGSARAVRFRCSCWAAGGAC